MKNFERIEQILQKIKKSNKSFKCNDNISDLLTEEDINIIYNNVKEKFDEILKILLIDKDNDHNTKETAKRVAKMFVYEIFKGRYFPKPDITSFPNHLVYDQIYITGPITIRSTCAHHWMPIMGKCYVGVFPGSEVIGLSKFNRLVDWICSRPQIQEEMTVQIADELENVTRAKGVAVVIKAEHTCLTHRGYREHENLMITSVMRGKFRSDPNLKNEFFNLLEKYEE
jgi:GTP cyclohydrolase I